ncbi:Hypothetical_protein [Hexamita inflata]|uniref:Hypothetical_protein n=1 Tax=Hexamita inflata TaxID=28002 RepID=A0AA86R250_9EUKA|nr:Hypothetical protein HINF_LOCUS55407 [Hexamita inflata]
MDSQRTTKMQQIGNNIQIPGIQLPTTYPYNKYILKSEVLTLFVGKYRYIDQCLKKYCIAEVFCMNDTAGFAFIWCYKMSYMHNSTNYKNLAIHTNWRIKYQIQILCTKLF